MDAGFKTIPEILVMKVEDFLTVDGFKDKMANKIYNSIQTKLKAADLPQLMGASNMFGRGLGTKRIVTILKNYPDIITSKASSKQKVELLVKLPGFKEKTANMFVPYIPKFLKFLQETKLTGKLQMETAQKIDASHPLFKKRIVMTGFRDKDLKKALENVGADLGSSVSKNTFVVIVKTMDDDTSKADKARDLNVPLMTPDVFKKKYQM